MDLNRKTPQQVRQLAEDGKLSAADIRQWETRARRERLGDPKVAREAKAMRQALKKK